MIAIHPIAKEIPMSSNDPALAIRPGSTVAIYYTHADGSHSAEGCWRIPTQALDAEPSVSGDTIGAAIVECCLNTDPGENGGVIVPVVSAEIVDAQQILSPWTLIADGRIYVRERFGTSIVNVALLRSEVEQARIDILAERDEVLRREGFRLL
jgi:hypothetical protein